MKDERAPSKAMIKKLLKAKGLDIRLNTFIRDSVIRHVWPTLEHLATEQEKASVIKKCLDDDFALDVFTSIFVKYFSVSEVMDLIAFYKSPTGQKLSEHQTHIAMDMIDAASKIVAFAVLKARADYENPAKDGLDFSDLEDPEEYEELS